MGTFYAPWAGEGKQICNINRPNPWRRFADTPMEGKRRGRWVMYLLRGEHGDAGDNRQTSGEWSASCTHRSNSEEPRHAGATRHGGRGEARRGIIPRFSMLSIIEQVQRALGWQPDAAVDTQLAKLEQALAGTSLPLEDAVPLLAALRSERQGGRSRRWKRPFDLPILARRYWARCLHSCCNSSL